MNTRVDIDEALAAKLEAAAKARGLTLKDFVSGVLNETVVRGGPATPPPPYVLKTYDFGAHLESPWTVLADLESQEYARKIGKK